MLVADLSPPESRERSCSTGGSDGMGESIPSLRVLRKDDSEKVMEFSIRGLNFTAVLYLFTLISIFLPYAHVNALEVFLMSKSVNTPSKVALCCWFAHDIPRMPDMPKPTLGLPIGDGRIREDIVVDVENYVVEVTPIHVKSVPSKGIVLCERVQVSGLSRLKLGSYSNAQRVSLAPSVVIPERLHKKIHICFHKNSSLGLCECEKDNWKILQNGMWSSVISPYEDRYIDVKFVGDFTGSVTVSVELGQA
ncbi:Uncharacterized protein Fot_57125 [Forsythia ovata]|uniref:Uncharacterized protein n=1 Tax=Forsythia ovata TaxID=205694 RepID=A0ABD1NWT2_9LAMI